MIGPGHPLFTLGLVLGAGLGAGWLAKRLTLPSITGQILIGVLLGPSVVGLVNLEALHQLFPMTEFALGLIAVTVGNHLNFKHMRPMLGRLGLLIALEATLTPALVFFCMQTAGLHDTGLDWMLGTMAIATAPATIVAIVAELKARGTFVRTLVAGVALNNMACVVLFEVARTYAHWEHGATGSTIVETLAGPGLKLVLPGLLGATIAGAAVFITRRVVRSDLLASASVIAILIAVGASEMLEISPLLTCLFLGVGLANMTPDRDELGHRTFRDFETAIFAVFFTLAGMELDLSFLAQAGGLAALYVVARGGGKIIASAVSMRMTGSPPSTVKYLGPSLIPQAGVAIGLVMLVRDDPVLVAEADLFLAIGLTAVTMNEIIGPIATRWGVRKSGEAGRDEPGAIDFLRPEHIHVGLTSRTLRDAVAELAERLVEQHELDIDPSVFTERALEQIDGAMYAGHGLAIPHASFDGATDVRGVMGISAEGLDAKTSDGARVHSVLLLAVPDGPGDPHVEIAAALGRAVGSDAALEHSLYHASDAEAAFAILHAFDDPDLNTMLAGVEGPPVESIRPAAAPADAS